MKIDRIITDKVNENCYLIYGDGKRGALIDPGEDFVKIANRVGELEVTLDYILLTHSHYDHSVGVIKIRGSKRLVCGEECNENIKITTYNLSAYFGEPFVLEDADIILGDGDKIVIDGIEVTAITTPGHTDGSMCFLAEGNLFTGDTLFKESVGRCDFPTGDEEALMKSIKEKLYTLPDETVVYPGHGESTTIGYEKKFNKYVK